MVGAKLPAVVGEPLTTPVAALIVSPGGRLSALNVIGSLSGLENADAALKVNGTPTIAVWCGKLPETTGGKSFPVATSNSGPASSEPSFWSNGPASNAISGRSYHLSAEFRGRPISVRQSDPDVGGNRTKVVAIQVRCASRRQAHNCVQQLGGQIVGPDGDWYVLLTTTQQTRAGMPECGDLDARGHSNHVQRNGDTGNRGAFG